MNRFTGVLLSLCLVLLPQQALAKTVSYDGLKINIDNPIMVKDVSKPERLPIITVKGYDRNVIVIDGKYDEKTIAGRDITKKLYDDKEKLTLIEIDGQANDAIISKTTYDGLVTKADIIVISATILVALAMFFLHKTAMLTAITVITVLSFSLNRSVASPATHLVIEPSALQAQSLEIGD